MLTLYQLSRFEASIGFLTAIAINRAFPESPSVCALIPLTNQNMLAEVHLQARLNDHSKGGVKDLIQPLASVALRGSKVCS